MWAWSVGGVFSVPSSEEGSEEGEGEGEKQDIDNSTSCKSQTNHCSLLSSDAFLNITAVATTTAVTSLTVAMEKSSGGSASVSVVTTATEEKPEV